MPSQFLAMFLWQLISQTYLYILGIYMIKLTEIIAFEWDQGNKDKNFYTHNVTQSESEQVFFNRPVLLHFDKKHSSYKETIYALLGKTNENRKLFIAFTVRNNLVRIISARDMTVKEKKRYEEHEKKSKA